MIGTVSLQEILRSSFCLLSPEGFFLSFFFFLVLPLYCYQPISLHHHAHILSHVTPWTAAHQAPLSMDFCRQEYQSGLPFPSLKEDPLKVFYRKDHMKTIKRFKSTEDLNST